VAGAPSAHAQVPCWHRVVADWGAGRLGSVYPVACYQGALAHLPEDMRVYSSAGDDIRRAMLAAVQTRATEAAASAAPPPRRQPAATHAPARPPSAVSRPAAKRPPRADAAARTALPPATETGSKGHRDLVLSLVVPGVAVLLAAATWVFLAYRRRGA